MSRLMKAFVGGACLLAGLMLLGRTSTIVQLIRDLRGRLSASAASAAGDHLDDAKPADREEPAAAKGQKPKEPEAVEPLTAADPNELLVRPDESGMLTFSFNRQSWPAVFEWLADISGMSLQREEVPKGYFTYATRKPCTIDEVRDTINCVLLSKGFTLLRSGEVLIVANLKSLNASLAPRVTIDELGRRDKHELVKTFVKLDWMAAETAAAEIKPLLSTYGKVAALKATNRLELLDTVDNLQRIVEMFDEEQSGAGRQKLVEEFRLKHTRAAEVLGILQTLLGIEPKSNQPADPPAIMEAQILLQQAQPDGQPDSPPSAANKEEESQVKLAVNSQGNSILAEAPPDKMAKIRRAISVVDVPKYVGQSPLANIQKMQVYRVVGVSPEVLVKILKDLGDLDPTTHLEIDQKNRMIIAFAPRADHVLIRSLVDKVDGTGRRFEVLQLRMLSAEFVAGSIKVLMNGPEKTDAGRDRSALDEDDFDDGESSPQPDAANRFQVEADIDRNRLLLRANDAELAEVKTLLTELGEIAPEERNGLTARMIPAPPGEETEKLLERLQKIWPTVAPNPLDVRSDAADSAGAPPSPRTKRPSSKTRPKGDSN